MSKSLVICIAIIVAGLISYYIYSGTAQSVNTNVSEGSNVPSMGMRAEENAVVVMEQKPGSAVTGSIVYLAAPGYLVIHEDEEGEPGAILGTSLLLPAGENTDVKVALSRASRDGETLHAMLHFEKGGNATFTAAEDTPVQSILGGPIHGTFEVSNDAASDVPVSI